MVHNQSQTLLTQVEVYYEAYDCMQVICFRITIFYLSHASVDAIIFCNYLQITNRIISLYLQ